MVMKLWQYNRKQVTITLLTGERVSGFVEDYCSASDNDEEMDSLLVDVEGSPREYFQNEVLGIEVINNG